MKKSLYILIVILSCVFFSCDDSIKNLLDKQIAGTDMVKLYFYDKTGRLTNKNNIITVQDKEIIAKLLQAISDETAKDNKCGYNGSMEYFKEGKSLLTSEFNSLPECSNIIFRLKDNMYSKKLSAESIVILNKYYEMIESQNKASLK
ncbi:MAG: hypothetical protein K1X86_02665 [Ignavibacteria bacterium]|nr:hypothetical protein [Ignavibacteria bacterium]